ncbi:MAG: hypothetical protein QOD06_622 [Candidatus Binatota bacterium]|nr:hypothetical protein [Candidatus Binatota bacterium]
MIEDVLWRLRTIAVIAASALAAVVAPAAADIFVWRDRGGIDHYTNDLALVPGEYREDVGIVARDWERSEPPHEDAAEGDVREGPEVVVVSRPKPEPKAVREEPRPPEIASVPAAAPIVQNVQIVVQEDPAPRAVPVFFGPVLARGQYVARRSAARSQGVRAGFMLGPAGPPPLGAAGPPPVGAAGPSPLYPVGF